MQPVEVEFTFEKKSYGWLMQRIAMRKQVLIIVLGLAAFAAFNRSIFQEPFYVWLTPFVAFAVVFYFMMRWTTNRAFNAATNLHEPMKYSFAEASIQIQTSKYEGDYEWSSFVKAKEMPDWFVLFQTSTLMNPVPKSAFKSAEDMDRFRAILQSKGLLKVKA